jgi:hypothetical protein
MDTPVLVRRANTKNQTPNSREAPGFKHREITAPVWSLALGISLVFGFWFFGVFAP